MPVRPCSGACSSTHARPGPMGGEEDAVYQFVTMIARGYLGQPVTNTTSRVAAALIRRCPSDLAQCPERPADAVPRTNPGQTNVPGPRLTIWSAMIDRWTSLVPSQIRSTRSSRKNRSATFSRM